FNFSSPRPLRRRHAPASQPALSVRPLRPHHPRHLARPQTLPPPPCHSRNPALALRRLPRPLHSGHDDSRPPTRLAAESTLPDSQRADQTCSPAQSLSQRFRLDDHSGVHDGPTSFAPGSAFALSPLNLPIHFATHDVYLVFRRRPSAPQ